jgi:bifunctional non-homologous end joining protein LigD
MLWRSFDQPARRMPAGFVHPSRPTSASQVPAGEGWLHEIKHDGYRLLIRKAGERVRLYTRRGYDWTDRYPAVTSAAAVLKANSAIIDGELVCLKPNGMSCFDTLHSRTADGRAILFAFDVIELDGADLKPLPLIERKAMLAELIAKSSRGEINALRIACGLQISEHGTGDGAALFRAACRMGLEGIVSKKMSSTYRPGPKACRSWIKVRNPKAPGYLRVRDGLDG